MNILIIGAAGGIGSQLLIDLSKNSSHNMLVGYHKKKINTPHESVEIDATKFEEVENLINKGIEQFGNIDAIINLPGNLILKPAHLCSEEEFYDWVRCLAANGPSGLKITSKLSILKLSPMIFLA